MLLSLKNFAQWRVLLNCIRRIDIVPSLLEVLNSLEHSTAPEYCKSIVTSGQKKTFEWRVGGKFFFFAVKGLAERLATVFGGQGGCSGG